MVLCAFFFFFFKKYHKTLFNGSSSVFLICYTETVLHLTSFSSLCIRRTGLMISTLVDKEMDVQRGRKTHPRWEPVARCQAQDLGHLVDRGTRVCGRELRPAFTEDQQCSPSANREQMLAHCLRERPFSFPSDSARTFYQSHHRYVYSQIPTHTEISPVTKTASCGVGCLGPSSGSPPYRLCGLRHSPPTSLSLSCVTCEMGR